MATLRSLTGSSYVYTTLAGLRVEVDGKKGSADLPTEIAREVVAKLTGRVMIAVESAADSPVPAGRKKARENEPVPEAD